MEIERSSVLGSTAGSLPAAANTRQHRAEEGKKPEAQQKIGSSKALALLTTLFERMERNADPANTQAPAYSAALNAVVGQVKTNTTQSKVSSWLVDEMSRLDRLLVQADKISISINCCYWSIGVSYREFCKVRLASCECISGTVTHVSLLITLEAIANTRELWRKKLSPDFALSLPSRMC
jgi:hypothetical protein